ncbi:MBL fold metallo-hydrolase [Streptomyces flaveolus]|uniref:MBL fold metallo-hydrolase n=1 Tax=Streptomyces flaveolus TaxID=67297 RepID=UPI0033B3DB1C
MERKIKTLGKTAIAVALAACSLVTATTVASASTLSTQEEQKNPYEVIMAAAASDPVTVTPLRGGVYLLQGSGGNIGVLPNKTGAFMVDSGIAVSRQKMESALQKLGTSHVKYLANTHWHFDHTDGNAWVHEQYGAKIIATPETLSNLSETITVPEWDHTFTPAPVPARPTVLVSSEETYTVGNEQVQLRAYNPGHTDGDLSVDFTKANVLFTGDIYWKGLYPFIDHATHGSVDGLIEEVNKNIAKVDSNTIIVPGHGPTGTREDLVEYRDMLVAIRDRVADLKAEGLTLAQIVAAKPTESFDAKWGHGVIGPDLFTELVYRGL